MSQQLGTILSTTEVLLAGENSLSAVLLAGNTTGATDIIVSGGQSIQLSTAANTITSLFGNTILEVTGISKSIQSITNLAQHLVFDTQFTYALKDGTKSFIYDTVIDSILIKTSAGIGGTLDWSTITASRVHTLPDASGTVALLSDITGVTLSSVLTAGNSTGANDIIMSTAANSIVCLKSDNAITTNRTSLCFVNGGASQDTIALTNPDFYTIPATQTGLIGVNGSEIAFEYHLSQSSGYYTTIDDNGWRFWINGGTTPAKNINLDPLVRIAMQSPDGAGFSGIFTSVNLTTQRTYTFQDADGTVAFLSDITGGGGWVPNSIPLGAWLTSGASFLLNTGGGGFYLSFSGIASDLAVFNDSLNKSGSSYDGSNLRLRLHMRLSSNGGVGDTVGWIVNYQFIQNGVNSSIGETIIAQQNVDVSTQLANIDFTTDLGLMTGVAGADTILVTLTRNSQGAGADSYGGNAEIVSMEWVKV